MSLLPTDISYFYSMFPSVIYIVATVTWCGAERVLKRVRQMTIMNRCHYVPTVGMALVDTNV
jgi:hypothetical protein